MYLCYLDESGDPGVAGGSATPTYTVAAVFVHETQWLGLFEDLLRFRRYLRQNFNLRMREEVKANQLVQGTGPWLNLGYGDNVRKRIYRSFMRLQDKTGAVQTFAVVVDKTNFGSPDDVRRRAWQNTLERIERFATKNSDRVMLFPDSGDYHRFRKLAREMRRFAMVGSMLGSGSLSRPLLKVLIDDPVERQSNESYMVQLADLNAYAAYRRVVPDPQFPTHMWEELGSSILGAANRYSQKPGEADGIVLSS